mmetsp:Transcript_27343/g.63697  ORF Transcript_27343/g.63697 Transcript_27343/m.63697 type:complete len:219 (+) Transcript_27343:290-946(+)
MESESCKPAPIRSNDALSQHQRSAASSSSAQSFSQTPVFRQSGAHNAGGGPSARRPRHLELRDVSSWRSSPSRTNASSLRTRPTAAGQASTRESLAWPKKKRCTSPTPPSRPRKPLGRLCSNNAFLTSLSKRPGGDLPRCSATFVAQVLPFASPKAALISSSSSNSNRDAKRNTRNNLTGSSSMEAAAPPECGTRTTAARRSAMPRVLGSKTSSVVGS